MPQNLNDRLVIAISSRALFNLDESHQVYQNDGVEAFSAYQIAREEEPLEPGEAFPLVHKLLRLNDRLGEDSQVEVVLLSRNSADTGLRVFNSIQHYDLAINRAAFCGGESPWRYINAFGCQLFLSNEAEDVRYALDCGVAAATLVSSKGAGSDDNQLRFAFDGDAVIFSDEAGFLLTKPRKEKNTHQRYDFWKRARAPWPPNFFGSHRRGSATSRLRSYDRSRSLISFFVASSTYFW